VVRLAALGGWLGLLLTVGLVVDLHAKVLPIPAAARDRVGEGKELAEVVRAWGIEPVYTTRYEEAAELSLYGGLEAYALPGVDRPDQYDLWPIRWASPALFVRPCKSGARLSTDAFCPERGVPGLYDGGPHEVRDGSGCWQVFVVAGCRDRF
jgi:hypothetical protein